MTETTMAAQRVYRLDKFVVPHIAREEFLARVKSVHEILREQPGYIQDLLLEQPLSDETFNVVTLVEWRDAKSIEHARAAVMDMHKNTGCNAQETMTRLGIKADMGSYKSIQA